MGQKIGFEAKLYYCAAGVVADDWTELTNVKDVTLNVEAGEADVTTRASEGWKATVAALFDAGLEFEMVWDTEDAGFTALQTAFFARSAIGLAIMDGGIAVAGAQGLKADFAVLNFSRNEPLEEALSVSVTVKPTYSATAPSWTTIEAS